MASTIAVEDLRVGMYIQLDGGWLSHPFPLSNFRIAGPDQLRTLRGLGLARVRWLPEKSDPAALATDDAPPAQVALQPAPPEDTPAVPQIVVPEPALPDAQRVQAEWLAAQRVSQQRCEAQYSEASAEWLSAMERLAARPQDTGATSRALAQAMLGKMLDADDVGIRLVSGGGDRAAAHALNVTVISLLIGRTLGLDAQELADLGTGALLHDVGKQDLAERHRHPDDGCSSLEQAAYRDHVAKGVLHGRRMLLSPIALSVLAQHHEHVDGSGFPLQLTGDRQSMAARIVAIVDQYDKLCNPCSRTPALTPHQAVAMLFAQGRQRYDTTVLNTFIRMMGVYPAGSLVQLTDDRYGMVVGVNSSRPLKPRVLVHDVDISHGTARPEAQLLDLECLPDLGIRRSLPASKVPAAALQTLDPRPRVAYYFEPIAREQPAQAMAA